MNINTIKSYLIISAVPLVLIIGFRDQSRQITKAEEDYAYSVAKEKVKYYQPLVMGCKDRKEGKGCCLVSVNKMRIKNYKLAQNGECPSGFHPDVMQCTASYEWCVPDSTIGEVSG